MPKGGARVGAGRPKGLKTVLTQQAIARAASAGNGLLPLDYLLEIMRDEANDKSMRIDAAKAAAPYIHARQVEHSGHVSQEMWIVRAGEQVIDAELDAETWQAQITYDASRQ